jgi:NAD(P)-dependent dehydrogenase (short-subunit alcohol dehydrogenase family)
MKPDQGAPVSRFRDKVVLVTGGGGGIGRATALAFAAEGAKVVAAGRDESRLGETVAAIAAAGGKATAIGTDVTDAGSVASLVSATAEHLGGLDIAVNSAGVVGSGPLADLDEATWQTVIDTNLTGVFHCLKHEMGYMRAHGGGAIVNIASNVGLHVSRPNMGAYAASKAAVAILTRIAGLEGIAHGIRVNALSPGASDTPMSLRQGETHERRAERIAQTIPIGRLGRREEIADAVLWLASEEAAFAVGADVVLDGGASA